MFKFKNPFKKGGKRPQPAKQHVVKRDKKSQAVNLRPKPSWWNRIRGKNNLREQDRSRNVSQIRRGRPSEHLGKQRQQALRKKRVQELFIPVLKYWRLLSLVLAVILGIVGFYAARLFFESTNYLEIKEIVVVGNDQVTEEEVIEVANNYIGKSLFDVDDGALEQEVINYFPYVTESYVRKFLPDKLIVEIEESFPLFSYINLGTALLVDEQGRVVKVFISEEQPEVTDKDKSMFNGFLSFDDQLVKDRYYTTWLKNLEERFKDEPEKDLSEFEQPKWDDVKINTRREIADNVRREFVAEVNLQMAEVTRSLPTEGILAELIVIEDFDNTLYEPGAEFEDDIFDFFVQMQEFSEQEGLTISKVNWQDIFKIVVQFEDHSSLLFTLTKPIDEQINAYKAVQQVEDVKSVKSIDLRGELVTVTR